MTLTPAAKAAAQAVLDKAAQRLHDEGYRPGPDGAIRSPYDLENHDLRDDLPADEWRAKTMIAIMRESDKRLANPEAYYPPEEAARIRAARVSS